MSIFTKLWDLIKTILPFLKAGAEKAYNALPFDAQQKLQDISKVVEAVKQLVVAGKDVTADVVAVATGVASGDVTNYLIAYAKSKGVDTGSLEDAVAFIKNEASQANATGLKSLWTGLFNVISEEFSHIDWATLLFGVGQFVYDTYVKDKISI